MPILERPLDGDRRLRRTLSTQRHVAAAVHWEIGAVDRAIREPIRHGKRDKALSGSEVVRLGPVRARPSEVVAGLV
ncbi:MAG TPA: hypothetical protein VGK96_22185 [Candidatus Sulfotelmatobacter sp.]